MTSSSSGSTRGSAGSGMVFGVEGSDVAARDARVEPEHDVSTRVSLFPPVRIIPTRLKIDIRYRLYHVMAWAWRSICINMMSREMERQAQAMTLRTRVSF